MLKSLRIILVAALMVSLLSPPEGHAYRYHRGPYHLTANTALLWDPMTNQKYFDLGSERQVFPASTTKVLTAILVLENLPLDKYVTVSNSVMGLPQTKLGLRPGETYQVRDLLEGLLMKSANDAAVVLAEAVAGSVPKFVDMMNARAKQIGAVHSLFANPHGLPSMGPQYTTAADMSLILNQALKNDFFRQILTRRYLVIYSKEGRRFFLKSHNRILFLNWRQTVFGKTGYTNEAQCCFLGYLPRGKDILIIAVYGARRRWTDMKFILEHYGHVLL